MTTRSKKGVALVLAGGRSTRFGRDKARERIWGKSALERVVDAFMSFPRVYVVGGEGPLPKRAKARLIDKDPGAGPLQAVISAFEQLDDSNFFLCSCDVPMLSHGWVRHLVQGMHDEVDACVPRLDGWAQPMVAYYRKESLDHFRQAWADGERSLQHVLKSMDVQWVEAEEAVAAGLDPMQLVDFDTPEQLKQLVNTNTVSVRSGLKIETY